MHANQCTFSAWQFSTVLILTLFFLAGCLPSIAIAPNHTPVSSPSENLLAASGTAPQQGAFADIPDQARIATSGGGPRPASYWALWNTCAPDNRASLAAANGGREAGWVLLDDLIADPGIQLGDYPVRTCEQGLSLLQGQTNASKEQGDQVYTLAAQLLAAELNLNAGAGSCPIAEEAVLGGHMVLAEVGFNGSGDYSLVASGEFVNAIPRLLKLLAGYNSGELCR